MNLRARVVAGALLIAATLLTVAVAVVRTTKANLLDQVDAQLRVAARPAGAIRPGQPPPLSGNQAQPRGLTALYVGHVEGDEVRTLVAPDLGGDDTSLPSITAEQARAAAASGEPFTVGSTTSSARYRARAFVDGRDGSTRVIALSIESVDKTMARLVIVEVGGAVVIVTVLGLVTWWVIHLGVRPLKRMTSVAASIAGGDVSHRVPEANPRTETGQLGQALNQMLTRIEAAFEARGATEAKLRQFVADASHELRTPVSTIRGYAELYRTGGLATADALDEAMRRSEQEAIRMGALVEELLELARLDQGRHLELDAVDLGALARDAVRDACVSQPGRSIEASDDGPVVVRGDEQRLRQVFANLVSNAIVHTPAGTPVMVRTRVDGEAAVIEVSDDGPGMTAEVAARAFERFYRADPARSRHRGGTGLGLSIVDAIVRAHGGTASLQTAPGRGTTVRVELPRDKAGSEVGSPRVGASAP